MYKNTPEKRLLEALGYRPRKGKFMSCKANNVFSIEFGLANGIELKVVDWPEYHSTYINIDKHTFKSTKEKIFYILKSHFSDYSCIGSAKDSAKNKYFIYKFEKFYVSTFSSKIYFYSPELQVIEKIEELTKEFSTSSDKQIYLLTSTIDGITLTPSKEINEPFIFDNYTKDIADQLKNALSWSQEIKPKGRILIMSGPPGTGKSYAIRGLISESNGVDWALVPSYLVPELSSPSIIASLMNERHDSERPLNLIIEDADSLLKKREESNPDVISQVLNLGDGILGELINVKLIMTTNCPRVNMDDAITRRGRLNAFIDFKSIPPEQAESIYKKLTNKEIKYTQNKVLCDIYADTYNQDTNIPKKEMVGNYL